MDEKLKQRLIGALVLIIAAVVFLPMLLSGQDETVRIEVEAPQAPELDSQPVPAIAPIELPAPEPVAEIPLTPPQEQPPAQPEPPVAEPEAPAVAQPQPTPSAPATGDWVIQLGSFSSGSNAGGLRDTLVEQGYNAYTHAVQIDGKEITRVYVGPLLDRTAANRLRDELGRRHETQGIVVAYDAASGKR